ncbi:MAG: DUF4367 domain-containing protein [Lachnospiraceae bacterium]|nr:DUF4367 domain-containing protein [Lachnospiraceae bacterium]
MGVELDRRQSELEDLRQHFPPMPHKLRQMIEQEVQKQARTASPVRRRNHMTRKALIGSLAAAMLLGTTVFAGVVYRMRTEKVGDYAMNTRIEQINMEERVPADNRLAEGGTAIQDVAMEVSYLPEGMVETEHGKYSFTDNLYKGGVSITFYKMDTGDAQFEMLTRGVKETQEVRVNGYDGVYFVLHGGNSDVVTFNQRVYVAYTDVHYVMEMYAASDVSREDVLKIAEGVRLCPVSDQTVQNRVHAYDWSSYLESRGQSEGVEVWNSNDSVPKSAMANTHAVGEAFAAEGVELTEDDQPGTGNVEIRVADVQISDAISLLDQSVIGSEERQQLQKEVDASGRLLPAKIDYLKYGDGIHSLNEVVDSREVPQKLVYITVEYTNTGTEDLEEVLFCGQLVKIVEKDGQMHLYKGKASDENAVWDEAVLQGAAGYTWMWYYDVHGGERQNNYITNLRAGETRTVHMAWLMPEEELEYLYLDMSTSGSSYEFCEESLAIGYVDIRQEISGSH